MISVLIADDHAIFRLGLRRVLEFANDIRIAGEARDGREALEQARAGTHDLLVLDLTMPGPSGIDLVRRVRGAAPKLPVLVLTVHDEVELAQRAVDAGASGYLTKDDEPETLLDAVRTVARGGNYIAQRIAMKMLYRRGGAADEPHRALSNREFEVFRRLAAGQGIAQVADALHISPKTVSTHKFRLMQKLGLRSERDLVRYAIRHGLAD